MYRILGTPYFSPGIGAARSVSKIKSTICMPSSSIEIRLGHKLPRCKHYMMASGYGGRVKEREEERVRQPAAQAAPGCSCFFRPLEATDSERRGSFGIIAHTRYHLHCFEKVASSSA